ncbi:alpha/beta hydrolase [Mycolicibacterium duvalii]|uniref:Uncharacterized protein n=1 Tax=Mycolicibacterium duvalii TaxID=39688 RepID=A0A7I7K0F7_9MYCO|nr:alpha/beta hydrolase [Mycolicibacterium duvalii]MCV7370463.1 alpha/beta hydrolase [Mycolicibacterium duvalii]PEG37389.1 alpha/beta hydrolase [Mycolicibacterium duvalii]BBX17626.1 hypothetical protein MDUV_24860 [Mycolicibacterium duvalii]
MKAPERVWRVTADFAGVLPRAHTALTASGDWNAWSLSGARQLGEVVLDQLALTGLTLTAPPPRLERTAVSCARIVEQLAGDSVAEVHAEPNPLRVRSRRRRRFGRHSYEQVTFDHDPLLPEPLAAEGFGGPSTAVLHLCRDDDRPRPWLVWVHGAGQGQPIDLLVSRARRLQDELGFNIALPVQPGCGVRQSHWPRYPGMDPVANVAGMMRAVSEVRAVVRWLRPQAEATVVSGVSMGSPVAGLVAHLEPVDAVAVYTPIAGLNAMIAAHLGRWGPSVRDTVGVLQSGAAEKMMTVVDYQSVTPSAPPERRLVVGAWYDQMAHRETAQSLHERWGGRLHWHRGSHVGHLFAPGVQRAGEELLRAVSRNAADRTSR